MKNIIYIFLFSFSFCFSQGFKIVNKNNLVPVVNASIDFLNGEGAFTDEKGVFLIPKTSIIDSIKISSIGFKTIRISYNNLIIDKLILLEEDISSLDEVLIRNLKTKTLKHKKGLKGININVRDFTYEELVTTYIPFPSDISETKEVTIKNIIINTTGLRSVRRRYYPFKVNLFSVSKTNNPPSLKDSLMHSIITYRKEGGSSKVMVDIRNYNIKLNKEGIFVSFETLEKRFHPKDTLYKTEKKLTGYKSNFNDYGAAVKTLKINPKDSKSYSFSLKKNRKLFFVDDKIENYWKMEKDFIYDITIEIEY